MKFSVAGVEQTEDRKTKTQDPPEPKTDTVKPALETDKKPSGDNQSDYEKDQKLAKDSESESEKKARETSEKADINRKTQAIDERLGKASGKIGELELHTINFADSIGKKLAADPTLDPQKESADWGLPAAQKDLIKDIPYMMRGLSTEKALFLIATGKDDQIQKGEKALVDLVRNDPSLQGNNRFSEGLLEAYGQMATRRKDAGLPPWETKLQLSDLIKEPQSKYPNEKRSSLEIIKEASQVYHTKGWNEAAPTFDRALDKAQVEHQTNERVRLQSFLDGMREDAKMAAKFNAGENVDDLFKRRSERFENDKKIAEQSEDSKQILRDVSINTAFAKIAGGDQKQFEEGKRDLAAAISSDPTVLLDDGYKSNALRAFKGHYQKSGDSATAPGATQPGKPGESLIKPPEKLKPFEVDPTKSYAKVNTGEDKKLDSYLADTLTTIGLTAFVIGTGVLQTRRMVNKYRAAAEARRSAAAGESNAGTETEEKKVEDKKPAEKKGSDDKTPAGEEKKAADKVPPVDEKKTAQGDEKARLAEEQARTRGDGKAGAAKGGSGGPVDVVFLHFNDLHSSGLTNGDVATMTEVMKERADQARKEGKFVLAIQGGDEFSGNTVSSYTGKGRVENEVIKKMKSETGLDFTQIIGNHAVDGVKQIGHLIGIADATGGTFAVSNLEFPKNPGAIGEGKNFEPYRIVKAKGPGDATAEVGIIGLTTHELMQEARDVRLKYETLLGRDAKEIADVSKTLDLALSKDSADPKKALPAYENAAADPEGKKDPLKAFREMPPEEFKLRADEFRKVSARGDTALGETKFTYTDAYVHAATDAVEALKAKGVHNIVIASHLGLGQDLEVAKRVSGVGLVLGAHSHDAVAAPHAVRNIHTGKDVAVMQAGAKSEFLGETEIKFPGDTSPAREYEVKGGLHRIAEIRASKEPGTISKAMLKFISELRQDNDPKKPLISDIMRDLERSPKFGADDPQKPPKASGTYSDARLRKGESCLGNLTADCMRCALNEYQVDQAKKSGTPAPAPLNGFLKHMGDVRNRIAQGAEINGLNLSDVFCNGIEARELVITTMTPQMLKDVIEFGIHDFPEPSKAGAHDYSGNLLIPSGVKVEYDTSETKDGKSSGAKYNAATEASDAGKPERQGDRVKKISVFNPETGKYDVVWDAAKMTPAELAADKRPLRIGTLAHPVEKWAKNGVFSDPERYPEFAKAKEQAKAALEAMGGTADAKAVHELAGFKLLQCDQQVKRESSGKWVSRLDISQPEALGRYLNGKIATPSDIVIGKGADGKPDIRPEQIGGIDQRFLDRKAEAPKPLADVKTASSLPLTDVTLNPATRKLDIIIPDIDEPRHEAKKPAAGDAIPGAVPRDGRETAREGENKKLVTEEQQKALDTTRKLLETEAPGLDLTKLNDQALKALIDGVKDKLAPAEQAHVEEVLKTLDKNGAAIKSYLAGNNDALNKTTTAADLPPGPKPPPPGGDSMSARTTEQQVATAEAKPFEAEKALELRKSGELSKMFRAEGMEEKRARELEEKLTSSDPKEREKAILEVDKYFDDRIAATEKASGTDGKPGSEERTGKESARKMRGWEHFKTKFGENKGRIATLIIVLGPVLPMVLSRQTSAEGSYGGTTFSK